MNMSSADHWDLVVMGAGIAGLCAAVRASEHGLRVLVVEQGEDPVYLCNSRFTGGAFHVAFHDIQEDPGQLLQVIDEVTEGFANRELAAAISGRARHATDWLRRQGVRFIRAGADAWRQHFLSPPGLMQTGLHWQGRGGDVMLRTLAQRLDALGGTWLRGWQGRELLMEGTRCVGLMAQRDGAQRLLQSSAVLLSDGGFQANMDLMREFVSPAPQKIKQRGAGNGRGTALQMGRAIGARLVGMENVYGHLLCQDALVDDALWPYPILDSVAGAAIVVSASGERFMDEGRGGVYMTNCVARMADPLSAIVIFDKAIWDGPATEFILPANPNLVKAGGTVYRADTLEALAQQLNVCAVTLQSTVAEYNDAILNQRLDRLAVQRTAAKSKPFPIGTAPFFAVRLLAGVTYTMGGLQTDQYARVLSIPTEAEHGDGPPIAGLYAAGSCSGGLEGGAHAGYLSGLVKASVMGLLAADHLALARGKPAAVQADRFGPVAA